MAGLLIAPVQLVAQSSFPPAASGDSATRSALHQELRAAPSAGEVQLDGRLDDPAWLAADSITDFRQLDPAEGEPSTERTVVRVLSGSDALHVGVRAYDRDVRAVRATQLRRDADLTVDDYITLLIDSFHDRRGAFLFRTNPNGAMWDAQLIGIDNVNENWNGIWEVSVTRDSLGWTAEFRIPYQTLRFPRGATSLGFNIQRFIRRKNEETLWQSYHRTEGLLRVLHEGELSGLEELRRGRPLELMPYVLGRATENDHNAAGTSLGGGGVAPKAGVDAKLAVSPTLTADFTVNTDFAQVEVDSQVINLTRFPVFFPEKRGFFLETTWRKSGHLILGAGFSRSRVSLSTGNFTALQTTGRVEYALNTHTDLLGFVQYNNEAQRVDFNLRFHWIPTIGDDVYVVWNSGYTTDPAVPHQFPNPHTLTHPLNGALVIKAVHRIVP